MFGGEPRLRRTHSSAKHPETNVINVELSTGLSGHEPNNKRRQTDKLRTRYLSNCNELRTSRICADPKRSTTSGSFNEYRVMFHEEKFLQL